MKKIISVCLLLLMVLTIMPLSVFAEENTSGELDSGTCGENITWTLYKDGELVISGTGDMLNYGWDNNPWDAYVNSLKSVTILEGVTSIGNNAFRGLYYLGSVTMPESITSIGDYAFSWTSNLRKITIPENVSSIGKSAFYDSDIEKIVLPDNITEIKEDTFYNCTYLECIVIPESITTIEENAFSGCSNINTVYYRGSEDQWNNISIASGNGYLKSAENIQFNSVCHNYESVVVAPTCLEEGYTEYTCTICGDSYTYNYTEILPHTTTNGQCDMCSIFILEVGATINLSVTLVNANEPTWTVSDTCAKIVSTNSDILIMMGTEYLQTEESAVIEGVEVGITDLNLDSATSNVRYATSKIIVVPHQTHTEIALTGTPATCTESGLTDGSSCSYCGEIITAQTEISALGHDYIASVTAPTCSEKGYTTYTCSICGDSYIDDDTEATGHTYTSAVTAPTCSEKGYTTYTCSICGDSYIDDDTEATGHAYTSAVTAPTCSEKGCTTYTCSICGDSYIDDDTEATGHICETISGYASTCTENGLTDGEKCSVCGEIITAQTEIPATGHDYVSVVTAPTTTEQGYTTYTCSVCGDSYIGDYVDMLPEETTTKPEETETQPSTTVPDVTETQLSTTEPTTSAAVMLGDVDGNENITAADARLALRISAKLDTPTEEQLKAADVNLDGIVNASDARTILRVSAKLETF